MLANRKRSFPLFLLGFTLLTLLTIAAIYLLYPAGLEGL